KLRTIVENAERLFAIELLAAGDALEFRRPLKAGVGVERAHEKLRALAPPLEDDRSMHSEIERVANAIRDGEFDSEMTDL
ncbi:MAG: histidine ammonia-lyase, partial [Verrucomicrobiota bacterium]|nr:histidine ammonia-lyase [Verrucomicrobiota bacterium]